MPVAGIVVEEHKSEYWVDVGDRVVPCTPRGTVRNRTGKPVAGDRVRIEILQDDPLEGLVVSVDARRNLLRRPVIANVDQVLYVLTVNDPAFDAEATDRFLFLAESLDLTVLVLLNKIDTFAEEERRAAGAIAAVYRGAGYHVIETSALVPSSIESILPLCRDRISCFAGTSGVGKTTIMNALFPGLDRTTQQTSRKLGRGRQTTTSTMLLKLPGGGYLADTPGFDVVELPYCYPEETQLHFPELKRLIGSCRFNNCLHDDEPGCAVKALVDKGELAASRLGNYLKFMAVMKTHKDKYKSG